MPVATAADLPGALRRDRLLDAAQLAEAGRTLALAPDSRHLAAGAALVLRPGGR